MVSPRNLINMGAILNKALIPHKKEDIVSPHNSKVAIFTQETMTCPSDQRKNA
ncbi:hypothetical protein SD78_1732 [Bacillus badius]|nr:hypothetical protein SD78_1732 [Bacillus badius]